MVRKVLLGALAAALVSLSSLALAGEAGAATTRQLLLGQPEAFALLKYSCGGVGEQVYATGFAPSGYPTGDVYLSTTCSSGGRGSHPSTHTAWATATWNWFASTRTTALLASAPGGLSTSFSATDKYGDRIYNSGTKAYLETTAPPLKAPAAPTGVTAAFVAYLVSEESSVIKLQVSWTPDPENAKLITSSQVTATPVGSSAPVLEGTVSGAGTNALLGTPQPSTTYRITVTNTDAEGTSLASTPIEATSPPPEVPPPDKEPAPAFRTCELNHGKIKLSPGLSETPHVQSITVKGELGNCTGVGPTAAKYVAQLKSTEAVTCSALSSIVAEATTTSSFLVKWSPKGAGTSTGTLGMPLTEVAGASLGGTLEGGPFKTSAGLSGTVSESFTGGPACGSGKKAKAVKNGTFTGSPVEI